MLKYESHTITAVFLRLKLSIFKPFSHFIDVRLRCTVDPRFTNAPDHEQFGSRTNSPSKNVSDDERCLGLRTRKPATMASWEYRRGSVSCWSTLAQYTSLLVFAVPSLEFHYVLCCFFNILLNNTPWDQRRIMIAKLNEVFVYILSV
jgi:hypothetical protein